MRNATLVPRTPTPGCSERAQQAVLGRYAQTDTWHPTRSVMTVPRTQTVGLRTLLARQRARCRGAQTDT
eukprot:2478763-Rhodomonas_salina.1